MMTKKKLFASNLDNSCSIIWIVLWRATTGMGAIGSPPLVQTNGGQITARQMLKVISRNAAIFSLVFTTQSGVTNQSEDLFLFLVFDSV